MNDDRRYRLCKRTDLVRMSHTKTSQMFGLKPCKHAQRASNRLVPREFRNVSIFNIKSTGHFQTQPVTLILISVSSTCDLKSPRAHLHVVGMLRFMSHINQPSLPTLLSCSCVYFSLYGPFACISFRKLSRQLSAFSLCSSGLISASLVLSTIYLFMKLSFSPGIILTG